MVFICLRKTDGSHNQRRPAWHAGVDFAGSLGSDVIAVASGVVVYSGRKDGYGNLVEIDHGNGVTTRYGHHDELKVQGLGTSSNKEM